jgi:gamma-glutamyltranspeptidase/glutathione hydrolase
MTIAAGLNVTEPVSTGIGGDMFLLYFDAATKQVKSLNGSGRSGAKQTLETIRKSLKIPDDKVGEIPTHHVHAATVPGAAAGWVDTVERFGSGKLSLSQILEPAIKLAENGFPLTEIASHSVTNSHLKLVHTLTRRSGKLKKGSCAMLLPTMQRCSRRTPLQKTA